ncbi:hypothetical protein BGZ83_002248 [Gryganskiella cystojenkinii]|nr:hypothetical protein BGZ83_002248 [Gryganskiella cystojenkinii]
MGTAQSSLAHSSSSSKSSSARASTSSLPSKSRNSFTKDRFHSHTLPTSNSFSSPNQSGSTLGSHHNHHHHLNAPKSAPASPTQYQNSHPQYQNNHGSLSPAQQQQLFHQQQKARRRSSNQTVDSSVGGGGGSTANSATSCTLSHPLSSLSRHSEEGTVQGDHQEFRYLAGRRFHNTNSLYMLPNDTQEVDRLHEQHYILKILFKEKNIHVPIPENGRVIDLGCGAATWTMDMATELGTVNFVGVDISPIYPTLIHPRNCAFYNENILNGISQPDNSFDTAYMRNVAPGFTFDQWQVALKEVFRLLKPGGWLESVESDVMIQDAGPYTEMCFEYLRFSMACRNVDPATVVRNLNQLFISVGFVDVVVKEYQIPFGDYGGQLGKLWRQNMFSVLETVKPLLAKVKGVDVSQVGEMYRESYKETLTCRAHQTIYVTYGRKPV